MDRTLDLLKQLAQELLVHSAQFEPFVPGHRPHPMDALKTLGKLEQTTQLSMNPFIQKAEAARNLAEAQIQTQAHTAEKAAIAARTPTPQFDARTEYKAALKDPGVVQALLDYHQATAPTLASGRTSGPQSRRKAAQKGFAQSTIAPTETTPKDQSFTKNTPHSRNPGSSPVLRKK
ncbi:MAG: hypothetical protein H7222_18635 [Methylotenera sp.]|nr:hypothetical protein [Oligoflexia bacterium]